MTVVCFFSDLALRPPEEIDHASALQSGSYAAAVFDDRGTVESAAMMVDGEVDCVRWFADAPSDELHARHVSRYGVVAYDVCRGEQLASEGGFMRTLWSVMEDGTVLRRDVLRFVAEDDDTVLETWRYAPDGLLIGHYVLENGRTVRGEEYAPDGTLRRKIGEE